MDRLREHQTAVSAAVGVTVAAAGAYYVWRSRDRTPQAGPYVADSLPTGAFDAVIVGAGPSGSTAAYYLARAGAKVSTPTAFGHNNQFNTMFGGMKYGSSRVSRFTNGRLGTILQSKVTK